MGCDGWGWASGVTGCATKRTGPISPEHAKTRLSFGGQNGMFHIRAPELASRVPAGEYRLYNWEIERKDDEGRSECSTSRADAP